MGRLSSGDCSTSFLHFLFIFLAKVAIVRGRWAGGPQPSKTRRHTINSQLISYIAAAALLAGNVAWAADGPQKNQIFGSLLGAWHDTRGDYDTIDGHTDLGGGIGWSFTDNWAIEGQYFQWDPEVRVGGVEDRAEQEYWTVNLLRTFEYGDGWSPYVTAGAGRARFDYDGLAPNERDTVYNLGLGFFGNLTERFALRGDVRGVWYDDVQSLRPMATLGLTVMLGGTRAAPAPAPAPAAAPVVEADSDGDGVPDSRDACPGTPAGVAVDERGCPLDSDGDGVPDYLDRCPGTPRGARVDQHGCEIPVTEPVSFNLSVEFAFDSAEITSVSFNELMNAIRFLREHPSTTAVVEGHTDSVGAEAYNQQLSQRRAQSVMTAIVNSGIAADRLTSRGYGESRPIASNDTEAGRQQNRRVTVVVTGTETRR
jgi:OmpA-OmpF porin, OOP family